MIFKYKAFSLKFSPINIQAYYFKHCTDELAKVRTFVNANKFEHVLLTQPLTKTADSLFCPVEYSMVNNQNLETRCAVDPNMVPTRIAKKKRNLKKPFTIKKKSCYRSLHKKCVGCNLGYFLNENRCKKCDHQPGMDNCEHCRENSICLICKKGYFLYEGKCSKCRNGFIINPDTNDCIKANKLPIEEIVRHYDSTEFLIELKPRTNEQRL